MPGVEYAVIPKTFWTDPAIRALPRDPSQLLAYYLTSPHSLGRMIGVYYCPAEYAAKEAKLPVEEVRTLLAGALRPYITFDPETEEVFVHAFAEYNVGEALHVGKDKKTGADRPDNRIAAVANQLRAVHSARLHNAFLARYRTAYHLDVSDRPEAPSKPLPEPLPSPSDSPSEAKAVQGKATQASSDAPHPARRANARETAEVDRREATGARSPELSQVAGAVRSHWWAPTGKPPADWDMGRELSIWRRILAGSSIDECLQAIQGARQLQLAGGLQRGDQFEAIAWLRRGEPLTARIFNHTFAGAVPIWTLALEAYGRGPPEPAARVRRPAHRGGAPTRLGETLRVPAR